MTTPFDELLDRYARVIVEIGLNLQPEQRLFIGAPGFRGGTPLAAAPLVRLVAAHAYRIGARSVDVNWHDSDLDLLRLNSPSADLIDSGMDWRVPGAVGYLENGDALLTIHAQNPNLFDDVDSDRLSTLQKARMQTAQPISSYIMRSAINWNLVSMPIAGWNEQVLPDVAPADLEARMWELIFTLCRIDTPDPIAAWQTHLSKLAEARDILNDKQYTALRYRAPGTELEIGLPAGHIWRSGRMTAANGIEFTANVPTEEVFTMPHAARVNGTVTSTKPLNYGGSLINRFWLRFENGVAVDFGAEQGETALRNLLETDEGARKLGEVALVPHSSPISQSGRLFYNTLYDENASSHIALGRAYRFTLEGGETMSAETFAEHGGNDSLTHVDFMIGSGEMDVDGVLADGSAEAVMRQGEWAY